MARTIDRGKQDAIDAIHSELNDAWIGMQGLRVDRSQAEAKFEAVGALVRVRAMMDEAGLLHSAGMQRGGQQHADA